MKTILFILIALFVISFTVNEQSSDFCDGWEEGYKEGYCYQIDNCLEPLVPLCPLPKVNESTYKHGYNRGFIKGRKDNK